MRFIGVRELRARTADIWTDLEKEKELVITSNGKPVALLTAVREENFERALKVLGRARAMEALDVMHRTAAQKGLDRLSSEEVATEVHQARRRS